MDKPPLYLRPIAQPPYETLAMLATPVNAPVADEASPEKPIKPPPPTLQESLPIAEVTPHSEVQDTLPIELKQVSYVFRQIAAWWPTVSSIDELGKMTAITFKAMEKRRDLLLLPNAFRHAKEENSIVVTPLP